MIFKEIISTENAPKAVGPYSHAVKVGNMMFLSGQIPLDPKSGEIMGKTIKEQTNQCFNNISAVLEAGGFNFGDVVSCDVYLTDILEFKEMTMEDLQVTYMFGHKVLREKHLVHVNNVHPPFFIKRVIYTFVPFVD